MPNIVYIATSLDGYIADKDNNIEWLHDIPNPDGDDFGYQAFIDDIDALIIGRNTLDTIMGFDCDWPYSKPVFVLSNTMVTVPQSYVGKVSLIKGDLTTVIKELNHAGFNNLYIDGGVTIQNFLKEDLIDELRITTIPILLGAGVSLFGELASPLKFKHVKAQRYLDCLVMNHFVRER